MAKHDRCTKCGGEIEPERKRWDAPTCGDCSAQGCGVPWHNGQPIKRCEGCDCMAPEGS